MYDYLNRSELTDCFDSNISNVFIAYSVISIIKNIAKEINDEAPTYIKYKLSSESLKELERIGNNLRFKVNIK